MRLSIRFFNNRYIVISAIYDNGRSGEIKILTVDGDVCRSIHKLTIDPVSGYLLNQYSTNNICFDGEYIYFDDMQVNDAGEAYWELYRYNVSSEMCEIIEENAQNPMLYGDSILYFSQNGEGRYNVLSCEDGTDMYEIGLALQSISSNGTNMYCISTPLTCHSDAYTVFELRDLLSNEIILSTKATITDVSAGSRFVSFINFVDDYVFIYDAVNDSLLVADELPKGLHFVYSYGDSGIIVTYTANGVCYFSFRASE